MSQYILGIKTTDLRKDSIKALNEEDVSRKIYWSNSLYDQMLCIEVVSALFEFSWESH